MKKTKKILSSVLAFATLLSVASCGQSGGRTEQTGGSDAAVTTTTVATTTLDTDAAVQDAAANAAASTDLGIESVDKKIKWLAWWDIDETQAAAEIFKAQYGVPEEGNSSYGADFTNEIFVWTNVAYADRYDKLGQMVAAGDSPDIFPFEIGYFPISAYMNMFQPIDGIVDTTTEDWSKYRDVMDQFMWGGKNWCAITDINLNYILWYRKTIIDEAGLEDPLELYRNGEWTWDKFLEMADVFQNSGESKYVIDGWNVPDGFLATTGVPLVSIEDGKLKSNLNDPAVERCMQFIEKLASEDYRYPWDLNGYSTNQRAWFNGDTLFFLDGTWAFESDSWIKTRERFGWEADELQFVPYPRDPNADTYYQAMKQDAYMLCSGAPNPDGFAAWTNCVLAASKDEAVVAAQREKSKRDFGWTDEHLDLIQELKTSMVSVWDFKNGVSVTCAADGMDDSPTRAVLCRPYTFADETYTQLRAEWENIIDTQIAEANAKLG